VKECLVVFVVGQADGKDVEAASIAGEYLLTRLDVVGLRTLADSIEAEVRTCLGCFPLANPNNLVHPFPQTSDDKILGILKSAVDAEKARDEEKRREAAAAAAVRHSVARHPTAPPCKLPFR
jgi:hypothetical protein